MIKRSKQKDKRGKPKLSSTQLAAKLQAEMKWRQEQEEQKKRC